MPSSTAYAANCPACGTLVHGGEDCPDCGYLRLRENGETWIPPGTDHRATEGLTQTTGIYVFEVPGQVGRKSHGGTDTAGTGDGDATGHTGGDPGRHHSVVDV